MDQYVVSKRQITKKYRHQFIILLRMKCLNFKETYKIHMSRMEIKYSTDSKK